MNHNHKTSQLFALGLLLETCSHPSDRGRVVGFHSCFHLLHSRCLHAALRYSSCFPSQLPTFIKLSKPACLISADKDVGFRVNWSIGSSIWTWGRTSSLWGWRSTGTGCPGRLWSLLWRYSRHAWTRSCAACCRWPCFGRGVGLDDPEVPSNPDHSVILWFQWLKRAKEVISPQITLIHLSVCNLSRVPNLSAGRWGPSFYCSEKLLRSKSFSAFVLS